MRRLFVVPCLVTAVAACSPAPPPSVLPAPATSTSAAPAPQGEAPATTLPGAWGWNDDVQVFREGGTGTYHRAGAVCYEFTYKVEGDVVTKLADRDHSCGATRELGFHHRFEQGELVMKHIGSGFESRWKRAKSP